MIFHATPLAINSLKIKQGARSKSDKDKVRREQKLLKPSSLVLNLVLSNCSVRCVLILCKTDYLITLIARLGYQLTGWWRKLHENCLWIVTVTEHFLDDPIKKTTSVCVMRWTAEECTRVLVRKGRIKGLIIIPAVDVCAVLK
jgi:hypothetical protein